MNTNSILKRFIAITLVMAIVCAHTGRAEAMLAPVDSFTAVAAQRSQDVQKIQTFLEQKQVSQKLAGYGFTAQEIAPRLSSLSTSELHQISTRIDQQHPAGDAVVTVLVIAILVLLFVYLLKRV